MVNDSLIKEADDYVSEYRDSLSLVNSGSSTSKQVNETEGLKQKRCRVSSLYL